MSPPPETICGYPVHPIAARLPLMSDAELAGLTESIRTSGQREPAVLLDGQILDGRNRARACEGLGLELRTREATPEERAAPATASRDANLHRRHLTESQRALYAADSLPDLEREARARSTQNLQRGPSAPQGAVGDGGPAAEAEPRAPRRSTDVAAASVGGVSGRSVQRAKALIQTAPPEVVEAVRRGETTLKRAEKDVRRAQQLQQIREYVPPAGEYPVIVVDPPWKYDDQLDGSDAARGGCPYPPMTVEEICALAMPAAEDCILWLWVTNTVLLEGWHLRVLSAWGFRGKTIYTWDKVDMIGGHWGRNVTEHVIIAVRGRPVGTFERRTTLFAEKRSRVHSEKPEAFYELVEETCPATPRLEMFARERAVERPGWVRSGAELPASEATELQAVSSEQPAEGTAVLLYDRFRGEAEELGMRVLVTKSGPRSAAHLRVTCAAKGCQWERKIPLTPERKVERRHLAPLRKHARTHGAAGGEVVR